MLELHDRIDIEPVRSIEFDPVVHATNIPSDVHARPSLDRVVIPNKESLSRTLSWARVKLHGKLALSLFIFSFPGVLRALLLRLLNVDILACVDEIIDLSPHGSSLLLLGHSRSLVLEHVVKAFILVVILTLVPVVGEDLPMEKFVPLGQIKSEFEPHVSW